MNYCKKYGLVGGPRGPDSDEEAMLFGSDSVEEPEECRDKNIEEGTDAASSHHKEPMYWLGQS